MIFAYWYAPQHHCSDSTTILQVEMILQALEYESEHDIDLGEFFESTLGKFKTHTGIAWAREVLDRRRRQQVDFSSHC